MATTQVHRFRSGLEERNAKYLTKKRVKFEYETLKIKWQDLRFKTYTPDFILPNGVYLETKGYWDADDRRKILAVIRDNPDIDLRMVFQAPFNKISKKSKTTYAQWCEKHNIKWAAVHAIPIDWLT